jgi:RNA polymerase sigma-70 factor (TIGR02960 family)
MVTRMTEDADFSALVERHRRELHVHCYRMLGSLEESEDLTQETFLRAWRKRKGFEGRSTLRAWLYRIATNACLDALAKRPRRALTGTEVPWLEPYPDRLLEELPAAEAEPDAAVVSKETIELAFMAAIQHLTPNQRAVLILRDVLGWPAKDTAALLDTSLASVTSSLQRARATLKRHLPERRSEWAPDTDPTREERALVQRYIDATERMDLDALAELLHEDARFTMPPEPGEWVGRDVVIGSWIEGGFGTEGFDDVRCIATRANGQPAVANYFRRPGESGHRLWAIDVLRIEDDHVAEIVTFGGDVLSWFGLPSKL